jgi:hypothetical protein
VEIVFGEDRVMRVRLLRDEKELKENTYSEKDSTLSCSRAGALIEARSGASSAGVMVGYESEKTSLNKAADGTLIVKRSSAAAGLVFLIVPAGGSTSV